MKKLIALFIFAGLVAAPVFGDSITVLGGYTLPKGSSDIYEQNELETTFNVSDLNGFGGTVRYEKFLGEHVNLGGGISFYSGETAVQDVDFEFENGQPILRDIKLEVVPIEVSLHLLPAGREAGIIPYVGGGFGLYYWQYEEIGDFVINRFSDFPEIVTGSAYSDGYEPGFHIEGGVYIPFSRSVAFAAEAKYWKAEGDLDVAGFDPAFEPIDLSGMMYSAGISIWF